MKNKKIGIITRHAIANYGSILQSYATQRIITNLGYKNVIINYIRRDEKGFSLAKSLCTNSLFWSKNIINRFIYRIIQTPNYCLSYYVFKKYRKEILKQTKEYNSIDELENADFDADIYCTGSDQVWGKIGVDEYDKAYFLDFSKQNKKCISYASSFGTEMIGENLSKNLKNLLKKYNTILVREKTAKDIIGQYYKSEVVLDPTLLIDSNEWSNIIENVKISDKNYVLVYQLHNNPQFNKYAKEFAKKNKLKLIRISPSINSFFRGGKIKFLPNPKKFLKYFKEAEYILTDSFHGTVFSILFNKKFIDILPSKTATRIDNLLEMTGMKNRILKSYSDFKIIKNKIDYNLINKKLNEERLKSIELLKCAIENDNCSN